MKKNLITAAAAALSLCICACGGQIVHPAAAVDSSAMEIDAGQTVQTDSPDFLLRTKHLYEADDNNYTIASGSCSTIVLTDAYAAANPALDAAVTAYSDDLSGRAVSLFKEIAESSRTAFKDMGSDSGSFQSGDMTCEIETVRYDSQVLSFFETCSTFYSGAAHGYTGYEGRSFDVATGSRIRLSDVFRDPSKLPPVVAANLISVIDGEAVTGVEDLVAESFAGDEPSVSWVLDNEGVTFRYAPSDITAYAVGTVEARIRFSDHPDLFTDKYSARTGAYVVPLSTFIPSYTDLNGDGRKDSVLIEGVTSGDEAQVYTGIRVTVNDKTCTAGDDFWALRPILVHTQGGRNYIYAVTTSDNDYETLTVFDLTGEVPVRVGAMPGTGFCSVYRSVSENWVDNYTDQYPVLNPASFPLQKRIALMSTYSGSRYYGTGDDGMPVPLSGYFTVDAEIPLTFKVDMTCDLVDAESDKTTGKTVSVSAGTNCRIWRTNGTDTVDLLLPDGRAVRVNVGVEKDGWPQTVNGVDLEEAFDGTVFAG
ncbi:MAG: hypothetical protein Q4F25_04765 [Eubacteriales bacterium]|nr:hypothetical protein [Eubacteriales bacterium]